MLDSKMDWGQMFGRNQTDFPLPKRKSLKRVGLVQLTEQQRRKRLYRRFIREAEAAGRFDLLDDETGLAFRNWKRMNAE